jgi:hypothetical protein
MVKIDVAHSEQLVLHALLRIVGLRKVQRKGLSAIDETRRRKPTFPTLKRLNPMNRPTIDTRAILE